jgi:hypothetical protein
MQLGVILQLPRGLQLLLDALASNIRRWMSKVAPDSADGIPIKHQRRYLKHERDVERCDADIRALSRFADAQVVAFRKILKKYKVATFGPRLTTAGTEVLTGHQKWTRSESLGTRFNTHLATDPKSFTHQNYTYLQHRCDELRATLKAASPNFSEPSSPSAEEFSPAITQERRASRITFEPLPPPKMTQPTKYWNEYDYGSDAGSPDDEYAIYINPDADDDGFPGLDHIKTILTLPFETIKAWFSHGDQPERRSLLSEPRDTLNYASTNTEAEDEDLSSVENLPVNGYATMYAFPSVGDQRAARLRERFLGLGSIAAFFTSYLLILITGILISTGKHKLRVEVDAGVAVGVAISLFCACSGLGMMLARRDDVALTYRTLAWLGFMVSCMLNGMLLVLVVSNMP